MKRLIFIATLLLLGLGLQAQSLNFSNEVAKDDRMNQFAVTAASVDTSTEVLTFVWDLTSKLNTQLYIIETTTDITVNGGTDSTCSVQLQTSQDAATWADVGSAVTFDLDTTMKFTDVTTGIRDRYIRLEFTTKDSVTLSAPTAEGNFMIK